MNKSINHLISRDLNTLIKELQAYPNESDLWKVEHSINNSAGSLALHLVGNLNHFIGHILGKTDYKRDREFELSGTAVPRNEIIEKIEQTIVMINEVIPKLSKERMNQTFEFDFLGERSTAFYMMLFVSHLSYHIGQINYHRRLLASGLLS